MGERVRLGHRVLRQQPDGVAGQLGVRDPGAGQLHRRGEARGPRRRQHGGRTGCRGERGDVGILAAHHDRDGLERARLRLQRGQHPLQAVCGGQTRVGTHDEKGVDSGGHDLVSLGEPRGGSRSTRRARQAPERAKRDAGVR
ncbi:hypothetical protein [Microbacterium elymi]|uniref:Uncharacterized protein n=1 Tax=Microbacterium elymi TaxID=2909587 RepID=A0ABY5NKN7_9MICO|nr:hypothetical protein [Microbacterium elymi]UUT35727.1 hypothetical protein L2X98_21120 [Microbacterium elymi]